MRLRSCEMVQKTHGQPEGMNTGVHQYATFQFESGEIADAFTLAELRHPEPLILMGCRSLDMLLHQISFSATRTNVFYIINKVHD